MKDKELELNIKKIKQLLTLPAGGKSLIEEYKKIDEAIELAVSLENPIIFERLLKGCSLEIDINKSHDSYLNDWMKSTIIRNGDLTGNPTGYYIWLSLLINDPLLESTNIKRLDLTNAYLKKLPKRFSRLEHLETLNLQLNALETFPYEIFKLKNLVRLDLGWNSISSIPNEISALNNLESLMIGDNMISDISDEISKLKKLRHLDIGNNCLDEFPDSIYKIKSLRNLNFINYDDENSFEDVVPQLEVTLPDCYIIEPVFCMHCEEKPYKVEDTIERWDAYFCMDHDEQLDHPYYYCDCCNVYVAPRGYTGGGDDISNNDSLNEGYDYKRWTVSDDGGHRDEAVQTIIKEDGLKRTHPLNPSSSTTSDTLTDDGYRLGARLLCKFCMRNIPKTDMVSYEDALEFAEDNDIYDVSNE